MGKEKSSGGVSAPCWQTGKTSSAELVGRHLYFLIELIPRE